VDSGQSLVETSGRRELHGYSFEVRFADGRPSKFFYWDDNPGRASITHKVNQQQALAAANTLARAEWKKL